MKTKGYLLTILLFVSVAGIAAQERPRSVPPAAQTAEREVRAVLRRWAEAVRRRDTVALDRIFASDLFITDQTGATRGKAQELDVLKPSASTRTISVTNEDVRIKTFPRSNTAVVTAIVRMVFRTGGRDSHVAMRYTSLWEKRAGRWQLSVLQTARLAK